MAGDGVIVGVDVGGTFTDLFLLDAATGRFRTAKVPSRRDDESQGFLNGLQALGGAGGMHSIIHGTTVGTNTLLERRGPKIGVLTTPGFRDTLEMRRAHKENIWDLYLAAAVPLVPRRLRIGVRERVGHAGGLHAIPGRGLANVPRPPVSPRFRSQSGFESSCRPDASGVK
jgi:N-methylhydantoinase A